MIKIYAKAPNNLDIEAQPQITLGKEYLTEPAENEMSKDCFYIHLDSGYRAFCLWRGCAFIQGQDWVRIEREEDGPDA